MLQYPNSFVLLTIVVIMNQSFSVNPNQTTRSTTEAEDMANGQERTCQPEVKLPHSMDPASAIAANFCFASGLELASLSVQASSPFPPDLYAFSLTILLAFSFLTLGNFALPSKHPAAASVLDRLGVLFAVTAFFIAIAAPFPLWMKCVSWIVYTVVSSIAAVAACGLTGLKRFFHSE